ncbi:MAG: hypothetical protein BroJett011_18140 [Chloroflexota bacterium]|nr:MAG: hypothetical protein BroJett011_18140 [Chloroflexota bacterium]
MKLPNLTDYQQAIQDSGLAFQDPELKKYQAKTDHFGMPRPISGGFALTFSASGTSDCS